MRSPGRACPCASVSSVSTESGSASSPSPPARRDELAHEEWVSAGTVDERRDLLRTPRPRRRPRAQARGRPSSIGPSASCVARGVEAKARPGAPRHADEPRPRLGASASGSRSRDASSIQCPSSMTSSVGISSTRHERPHALVQLVAPELRVELVHLRRRAAPRRRRERRSAAATAPGRASRRRSTASGSRRRLGGHLRRQPDQGAEEIAEDRVRRRASSIGRTAAELREAERQLLSSSTRRDFPIPGSPISSTTRCWRTRAPLTAA